MKLAILFPGIGYHCDKPLLYYSKKILQNEGYESQESCFHDLDFDLNKAKDKAYAQAKAQMPDFSKYDSVLFISKSIGTYCAAKLACEYNFHANIYFTPLDSTLDYLKPKDLVYSGTKDQWADYKKIEKYCIYHCIEFHSILNGNHSLETKNIQQDIENLKNIMKRVEENIHNH